MDKKELVNKLVELYKQSQQSGESAMRSGIDYNVLNKTLSIDINDKVYILPFNNVTDDPDVGDDMADKIKAWVR